MSAASPMFDREMLERIEAVAAPVREFARTNAAIKLSNATMALLREQCETIEAALPGAYSGILVVIDDTVPRGEWRVLSAAELEEHRRREDEQSGGEVARG